MGTNAPGGNGINGNILINILNGDISANTITDTVQGFLLSGSLTTDEGIGDNVGVTGANIIGNPLDTTVAMHYLIFGGVLERFPNLKFVLSHGGAFAAAYAGRMDHAYGARPDCRENAVGMFR